MCEEAAAIRRQWQPPQDAAPLTERALANREEAVRDHEQQHGCGGVRPGRTVRRFEPPKPKSKPRPVFFPGD